MVRLNTHDASILARVAQYDKLPEERKKALLDTLQGTAREIGEVIVHNAAPSSDDVETTASRIRTWAQRNRKRARYKNER